MKPKFRQLYSNIAEEVAKMSHARRLQVGAVIVKDDRVISMGYNGMPAGWENDCEQKVYKIDGWLVDDEGCYELKTKPEVLHAETNAIAKLARSNESGLGADMFITHAPCMDCAKLIYQSGIGKVYYNNNYRDDSGIKFLKQSGVEVIKNDD
jgi:dCMP deaminase